MGVLRRGSRGRLPFDISGALRPEGFGPLPEIDDDSDIDGLPWHRRTEDAWTDLPFRNVIRSQIAHYLTCRPVVSKWELWEIATTVKSSCTRLPADDAYLRLRITTCVGGDGCGCTHEGCQQCEVASPFPVEARNPIDSNQIFARMFNSLDILCGLVVSGPSIGIRFYNETPSGAIDGVNTDYLVSQRFFANRESVYLNGVRQKPGATCDYVRLESGGSGTGFDTIRFVHFAPIPGDSILIDYDLQGV